MSIYLDEKNPGKHPPFDDASPDIVEYVRYLEVIAGKSANHGLQLLLRPARFFPFYETPPRAGSGRYGDQGY